MSAKLSRIHNDDDLEVWIDTDSQVFLRDKLSAADCMTGMAYTIWRDGWPRHGQDMMAHDWVIATKVLKLKATDTFNLIYEVIESSPVMPAAMWPRARADARRRIEEFGSWYIDQPSLFSVKKRDRWLEAAVEAVNDTAYPGPRFYYDKRVTEEA